MTVNYLNQPFVLASKPLWWQKQGLQQTASGYGRKLTTEYVLTVAGEKRAYRVYAICFSNVASFYVLRGGVEIFVRDSELDAARDVLDYARYAVKSEYDNPYQGGYYDHQSVMVDMANRFLSLDLDNETDLQLVIDAVDEAQDEFNELHSVDL